MVFPFEPSHLSKKRNVMLRLLLIKFVIWVAGLTVIESTELEVDVCPSDSNPTTYRTKPKKTIYYDFKRYK